MSLAIDVDTVEAVLLADGWHIVDDASFFLDSYEYLWWPNEASRKNGDPQIMHGGGQSGVCATGFSFIEGNQVLSGPLTAVIAVKTARTTTARSVP